MNNEKKDFAALAIPQAPDAQRTPKHERVGESIGSLCVVLVALERLSSKVSGEPPKPQEDTRCDAYSLEAHLITAPERINSFINAAGVMIEQIEEKLF